MTFLYPNFLWLLSLASVPIILHLLSRIRLKRVEFSALYFLKDAKKERFSWLRLKEILLLICRTLLVIFLFLALARPKLQGRLFSVKRQAQVAILIDDSYSLSYDHRFELAKNEAKRILTQLSTGSEVLILTSSGSSEFYQGKNLKNGASFIDSLLVSYYSADLNRGLIQAQAELEKSSFVDKEIFIITDLQKYAFAQVWQNFKLRIPINVVGIGGESENTAVTAVFLSERFPQIARPAKPVAKIRNYGKHEIEQRVVLKLGDKTEEKRIKLTAGEEKTLFFETEIGASGQYSGSVLIEPDSLRIDDQRYFVFSIPEKIPVLLVYAQKPDGFYLAKALAPESSNTFAITETDEKGFRQKNLTGFAMIGLINPSNFTRSDWQRLDYYIQQGGKVFVSLGSEPKDKTGIEPFLEYEISMKPVGFISIERFQDDHPIFEVFAGGDLSNAKFFQWSKVKPKRVKTLASFSDGSPFLLESEDHNYIIATTNFNLDGTDIVFKPVFLPLIQRIFFYLAKGDFKTEYEIGSTIATEAQTTGLIKVKTPNQEYSVTPEIMGDKRVVKLPTVKVPGIYQIEDKVFAVNVNPLESNLTRVKESDLNKAGLKLAKESAARATDLTGLLLFLVFLALALEMVFLLI